MVLGPYNLPKKSYGDYSPGGGTKVMLAPGLIRLHVVFIAANGINII